MVRVLTSFGLLLMVAGCANIGVGGLFDRSPAVPDGTPSVNAPDAGTIRPQARPDPSQTARPPAGAQTAEAFDTTTAAEKAAAQSGADGRDLGVTIASLGAPTEPGFWLKTPLVSAAGKGRVLYPISGKSAQVDLIPLDGAPTAGSQMSLAAMRLIDAPLTGLPEIRVFALTE